MMWGSDMMKLKPQAIATIDNLRVFVNLKDGSNKVETFQSLDDLFKWLAENIEEEKLPI